ncbi:MAG: PIG-L family deacetylase [Armatimonadota bacterium]
MFAIICAGISLKIRAANSSQNIDKLPSAEGLSHAKRLLVIAPHPDDEALACSGLIQRVKRNGGQVRVVYLTCGDGFRVAMERTLKEIKSKPTDFIRFGEFRQNETAHANSELNIKKSEVVFLGYPDRGLVPMWKTNWTTPYKSYYTKVMKCPYRDAYCYGAPYTGQGLVKALSDVIGLYQPTSVLVTHPLDDHPDHYAAYAFTTAALEQRRLPHPTTSQNIDLQTYLVHRGGVWPTPQRDAGRYPMAPPAAFSAIDGTSWEVLKLSASEVAIKDRAINAYKSQTAIMGSFLRSFGRKNELFGKVSLPHIPLVANNAISADGNGSDWASIRPQLCDPVGDTVSRTLREGADIKTLWLARDARNLYVRIDTAKNIPGGLGVRVMLRSIDGSVSHALPLSFTAPKTMIPTGSEFGYKGSIFEAKVPLGAMSADEKAVFDTAGVWAGASTYYLGFNVDKTGWRPMTLARR